MVKKGYTKMKSDNLKDKNKLINSNLTLSDEITSIIFLSWVNYSYFGYFCYLFLCFISLSLFYFICLSYNNIKEWFIYSNCLPNESKYCIIKIENKKYIVLVNHYILEGDLFISFEVNCKRYWTSGHNNWNIQVVPDIPDHFSLYLKTSPDHSLILSRDYLRLYYGLNKMELPKQSFFDILFTTMFHPFYLFQYFAVILWMIQDYVLYSLVILFITGGAIYLTTSETLFNLERLHDLAGKSNNVFRIDHWTGIIEEVSDTELVPGDHIILKQNTSLPCDCILLTGRVSVDESMLTGESIPVNKSPIDTSIFITPGGITNNNERDGIILSRQTGSILYSGTKLLVTLPPTRSSKESKELKELNNNFNNSNNSSLEIATNLSNLKNNCIGVVYRTSFRSAKGQLISTLLNPQENFMSFFSDALYVILFMAVMCTFLYLWSAFYLLKNGASLSLVGLKYLDALTIAVPPGLTASLTVATGIAINRLKEKGIYVSESTRVNWAGIISAACFDKTGTLTEERLQFKGIILPKKIIELIDPSSSSSSSLSSKSNNNNNNNNNDSIELSQENSKGEIIIDKFPFPIIELMGTCHALSLINEIACGDPLEVELFRCTNYALTPTLTNFMNESVLDNSVSCSIAGSSHDNSAIRTIFSSTTPSSITSSSTIGLPKSSNQKYRILKHFEFTSEKLRSGSVVQRPNKDIIYYCKGSPEVILKLVKPDSIPFNIENTLSNLSKRGFRVIATCFKVIERQSSNNSETIQKYQSISQSEYEKDSIFLGLLFLSNALKPDTVMTIKTLRNANIPCTMITGDHIYTAIAIGIDCHLFNKESDVNIIDEDENSATGLQISSMLTGSIVSYNLGDFLTAIKQLKENQIETLNPLLTLNSNNNNGNGNGNGNNGNKLSTDCNPCSIQIALTGRGLEVIKKRYSDFLNVVLELTQVFARMKPSEKQFIVQEMEKIRDIHFLPNQSLRGDFSERSVNSSTTLQISVSDVIPDSPTGQDKVSFYDNCIQWFNNNQRSTHVLFCGDGANDMAALRSATVGVSLCEAETSVAAPITSRYQTPGSVIDVIKEGRCSLITAYVLVSFNIMYATIQLFNAIMMYHYGLLVGNNTYLIQDLFYTLFLGLAISITPPAEVLGNTLPPLRFFTKYLFFKLFLQLLCFPIFQIIALKFLANQPWYVKYDCNNNPLQDTISYETSVIASIGLFQLIIASIVSCIDKPFRQEWYKNKYHLTAIFFQSIFLIYQIFSRKNYFTHHVLEIQSLPLDFCWILIFVLFLNGFVSFGICWFVDYLKEKQWL